MAIYREFIGPFLADIVAKYLLPDLPKDGSGRVRTILSEDARRDVVLTLQRLELSHPDKAELLWKRVRLAQEKGIPDIESNVINSMGKLLPRDEKVQVDVEKAKEMYIWLAGLSDEQFALVIEAMKHNPIAQTLQYFLERGFEGFSYVASSLLGFASRAGGKLEEAAGKTIPMVEPHIQQIRQVIQNFNDRVDTRIRDLESGERRKRWIF